MAHLVVLFHLITLFLGLALLGLLGTRWRRTKSPLTFWRLFHFAGFTFTMVVAALDAYAVVNLGTGNGLTQAWSAAVMAGTAVMTFSFPHFCRALANRTTTSWFSLFWGSAALVPLAGAAAVLFLTNLVGLLVAIGVAFLPFWAAILYGLSVQPRRKGRVGPWLAFAALLAVGAAEVTWVLVSPQPGHFFITLPLAYLYAVVGEGRAALRQPALELGPLRLSPETAHSLGLSPREREVAEGILRGLSNKELAWELGLAEQTVRNHISNLYRKLHIQKRMDLVVLVQKSQGAPGPTGTTFPSSPTS